MNFLREITEGLRIAWDAIRANKLRSGLTTLGIFIGVATVTLMSAAITGMNASFLSSVSSIGANVFYVDRFAWFGGDEEQWLKSIKRRRILPADYEALKGQLTLASAIAPVSMRGAMIQYRSRSASSATIVGTTEDYVQTSGIGIAEGRFLSPVEVEQGRPVCVLGAQVETNLFARESPLGAIIKINRRSYAVVGVMERQGLLLGEISLDNRIVIPLKRHINDLRPYPDLEIQVKAANMVDLEEAREELRQIMRRVRRVAPTADDDFNINQQDEIVKMFHRVADVIGAVGLFITGLSLFVGGIGIMNIMLVSVAERTREIGIRKAIGARRRTILLQFLIEAACICLIGGLIGLGVAWPITVVASNYFPAAMSAGVVAVALGVSLVTGLVSGFIPALRAARMDPVDALRSE